LAPATAYFAYESHENARREPKEQGAPEQPVIIIRETQDFAKVTGAPHCKPQDQRGDDRIGDGQQQAAVIAVGGPGQRSAVSGRGRRLLVLVSPAVEKPIDLVEEAAKVLGVRLLNRVLAGDLHPQDPEVPTVRVVQDQPEPPEREKEKRANRQDRQFRTQVLKKGLPEPRRRVLHPALPRNPRQPGPRAMRRIRNHGMGAVRVQRRGRVRTGPFAGHGHCWAVCSTRRIVTAVSSCA
jgi:hypothetical protein